MGRGRVRRQEIGDRNARSKATARGIPDSGFRIRDGSVPTFLTGNSQTGILGIHHHVSLCNFHFTALLLRFPSCSGCRLRTAMLLSALADRTPTLARRRRRRLFRRVRRSCRSVPLGTSEVGTVQRSRFFGTLRIGFKCTMAYRGTRNKR